MKAIFNKLKSVKTILVRKLHQKITEPKPKYDAVIIGAGHNGLVCASYLQKHGHSVCVLERRHIVGGASVTEEIVPDFKFSRASYVLSLLRPQIYEELELKKHGLHIYERDPSLYTPLRPSMWKPGLPHSLIIGRDNDFNQKQIARFSCNDAEMYPRYEQQLMHLVKAIEPLLDIAPTQIGQLIAGDSLFKKIFSFYQSPQLRKAGTHLLSVGNEFAALWDLMTAPAGKILSRWFESEPLKATLATDAVIGSMVGPDTPGSGYVLMHHMMGQVNGKRGAWGYPRGGMGAVSQALASSATSYGAHVFTNQDVQQILLDSTGTAIGVVTADGREILSSIVLSNATPHITFLELIPPKTLPSKYESSIRSVDYTSPVTKINVALNKLPNFISDPSSNKNEPLPHHRCTINLNCEELNILTDAYEEARTGKISTRPLIEMVLPSSLDDSLCPKGCHVCLLFTQYTPYHLKNGQSWDDDLKEKYAQSVFNNIEEYIPGFSQTIVGKEILSPADLENEFGLTGGNIFHGAISLDQLLLGRPAPDGGGPLAPFTPVPNLLLCGSGSHPGGGVMGAAGLIAAQAAYPLLKKQ